MKRIILSALTIVAFASCKKLNDVLPDSTIPNNQEVTKPATEEDKKLLATLTITPVIYKTPVQVISTSVEGSKLNLAFNEKVHLLIDKDRYSSSWYIIFNEDYSGTALQGLDYTTVTQWGTTVKNWKSNNLNQFVKIVTDTTIAGKTVVNVKFERKFNFYKEYDSAEQAITQQTALEGKTETVKYVTRYEPDSDTTRFYNVTAKVIYKK
ncbi:hypothetical protein LJ707_10530 [Mucilaginibacter sp. UR6-1]|uniref:hypothetical protein n=1 Tax=Mucilaginibacter sp. UR6-1 TaxID=1435643 RepID=UPI001E342642|nr:hypothetical protein [Mucilaginibacter sp. UR6-1]MCC8409368.1 hypothetical protein [Mucilaginibacter sp. UR6-1]